MGIVDVAIENEDFGQDPQENQPGDSVVDQPTDSIAADNSTTDEPVDETEAP
jgi:hypothetical protein